MKTFKINNILVPTDFSETANHALDAAIELSKRAKAYLTLMHVVETPPVIDPLEMINIGIIQSQMVTASNEGLKKLASKINREQKIKVEYKCYCGNIYENIINAANIFKADLIVMGTHGTSGVREWLFGSNAFRIVNNTPIPVITINRHFDEDSISRIVFPFNENLLTIKKFEQVIYLAKLYGASVLLFGFTTSRSVSTLAFLRSKAEEIAKKFAKENVECNFALTLGDDYAEDILKFANESHAGLISVITNRSHSLDQILKSKPDKKLVNHSKLPVLCVPVD